MLRRSLKEAARQQFAGQFTTLPRDCFFAAITSVLSSNPSAAPAPLRHAFRLHFRKDVEQLLVWSDHKCGPRNAPHLFAVHVLFFITPN